LRGAGVCSYSIFPILNLGIRSNPLNYDLCDKNEFIIIRTILINTIKILNRIDYVEKPRTHPFNPLSRGE